MSQVHGKTAGVMDWECRQSRYTRPTFSFRIADVRKVGLKSKQLTEKKSILKHKEQPVDPGFIGNSTFNTISLLVTSFENKVLAMSKLSRLSRNKNT